MNALSFAVPVELHRCARRGPRFHLDLRLRRWPRLGAVISLRSFSAPVSAGPDVSPTTNPQVAVYRFWSPGFKNAHFFTTDEVEAENILWGDGNWQFEGWHGHAPFVFLSLAEGIALVLSAATIALVSAWLNRPGAPENVAVDSSEQAKLDAMYALLEARAGPPDEAGGARPRARHGRSRDEPSGGRVETDLDRASPGVALGPRP